MIKKMWRKVKAGWQLSYVMSEVDWPSDKNSSSNKIYFWKNFVFKFIFLSWACERDFYNHNNDEPYDVLTSNNNIFFTKIDK